MEKSALFFGEPCNKVAQLQSIVCQLGVCRDRVKTRDRMRVIIRG